MENIKNLEIIRKIKKKLFSSKWSIILVTSISFLLIVSVLFYNQGLESITGYFALEDLDKDKRDLNRAVDIEGKKLDEEKIKEKIKEDEFKKQEIVYETPSAGTSNINGRGFLAEREGFYLYGLREGLSLFLDESFLNPYDTVRGHLDLALYRDPIKIAEFNINVTKNIDLFSINANTSLDGKSFVYDPNKIFKNLSVFIPRVLGHEKIRICENASSFQEIYQGCINNSNVTLEYVLDSSDEKIKLSEDGLFFIVNNFSSGGAGSEGEKIIIEGFEIEIISPGENSGDDDGEVVFIYNVSSDSDLDSCKLIIDDSVVDINENVSNLITNNFTYRLKKGKHFWTISCTNSEGEIKTSLRRRITVIPKSDVLEMSLDLNKVDIEKVEGFYLKREGFGLIEFLEAINLSRAENLSEHVIIKDNFISIDSEKIPEFNKPAILTFYGLDLENPIILKDGKPCSDCQIISYDGALVFKVNKFSNYSATENSQLEIWDDTDFNITSGNITMYANYTNVTDGSPIVGTCVVDYGDGEKTMNYDSGLYNYTTNFSGVGVYYFNVNCSSPGFTSIFLTDYVSIRSAGGPSGASVSEISTSTASADNPQDHLSYAANVTNFDFYGKSVTQSWQGYYGSVSGTITLKNSIGDVFYNWSAVDINGEVYASSARDVNFATIGCANDSDISSEESKTGQNSSDVDSVRNTFDEKNHPGFFVGSIKINPNSCNSTNLYDNRGEQSSYFYEVLLADDASNLVYTGILEKNQQGFDGSNYDFQIIVSEDGHGDSSITTYYFYLEFG